MKKNILKCSVVSLIIIVLLTCSGCNDDCADSDQPFTLQGEEVEFQLIDRDTEENLVQDSNGLNGIYPADQIKFYDGDEVLLSNYFLIENGIISYRIANEVNLQTNSIDYFIQFSADTELIPFTLVYMVREDDCFNYLILEAGISIDSELRPLSPNRTNEIFLY